MGNGAGAEAPVGDADERAVLRGAGAVRLCGRSRAVGSWSVAVDRFGGIIFEYSMPCMFLFDLPTIVNSKPPNTVVVI